MNRNFSFWVAFFTALGAMLVLSPRSTKTRDGVKEEHSHSVSPDDDADNIASYFDQTGEYLSYGIKKISKAKM